MIKKNDAYVCNFNYGKGWEQWVLLMSDEHFDIKNAIGRF